MCELVGLYLLSQLQRLDINVGLYRDDGLAVCELVGLYLLSQLQRLDINVGLYRDDGLECVN